jgi:hypothetical protein
MNRRKFLTLAGLSTIAATCGSTVLRVGSWWDQDAAVAYQSLSEQEAGIAAAIVDALFPGDAGSPPMPNGVELGVVEGFDAYLAGIDPMSADMLRMLLHAIDDMAVFSDFGLTRFHKRPRHERIAILREWDNSGLMIRRSGFRALKFALGNHYCNHPDVLRAAGIHYSCGGTSTLEKRHEGV